jgi:hypothetical protein
MCDLISSRLSIPENQKTPCAVETEIEELNGPFEKIGRDFLCKIEEYNYFPDPKKIEFSFKFLINYIPPWSFMQWASEEGDFLNFLLFLKDSPSMVEFFNPFSRNTIRYKGRKGLIIVLPSVWLFTRRYTNTLDGDALFVMGFSGIVNSKDLKRT